MAPTEPIKAWAAYEPNDELKEFEFNPGPLGDHEVDVSVKYCGICHSDLHMINNDWGMSKYPLVPGHEVVGTVLAVGSKVTRVEVGQHVGVGWPKSSCMFCDACIGGAHHMCPNGQATIVGNHGGFADRVRCGELWTVPLPAELDEESAGPLLCAGATMFTPILDCGIKGTDRVGVVGIGGLGHIGLMFLKSWGCHVTAFTSSADKVAELKEMGAHDVVISKDPKAMNGVAHSLDVILSTLSVDIDYSPYFAALKPKGRLHMVGLPPSGTLPVSTMALVTQDKSVSGSIYASLPNLKKMLEFVCLHNLKPLVEVFPMSQVNEALKRMESGKARYRVVLKT